MQSARRPVATLLARAVALLASVGVALGGALGGAVVPTAAAGVAIPVNCNRTPTELRLDDATYELRGTCGTVKVLADDVTVRMPTATRLVVRGHRNTVVSKSLGGLLVEGRHHDVRPTSVRTLTIASPGSTVAAEGLVETARLRGRGATLTAGTAYDVRVPGSHHTVRARQGYDVRVGGDDNGVRFRRLDSVVATGDDNSVAVRRGATSVRNTGDHNRIRVARRG